MLAHDRKQTDEIYTSRLNALNGTASTRVHKSRGFQLNPLINLERSLVLNSTLSLASHHPEVKKLSIQYDVASTVSTNFSKVQEEQDVINLASMTRDKHVTNPSLTPD